MGAAPAGAHFAADGLGHHIPREQILWDTATSIGEAPFVVREYEYTWSWINQLASNDPNGGWDLKAIEKMRGHGRPDSPGSKIRDEKEKS